MEKLSKKQLKNYAESKKAYYFTGNVYSYENIIFYLNQLAWRTKKGEKTKNIKYIKDIKRKLLKNINKKYLASLQDLVKNIETIKHNSYKTEQEFYSAGVYGNNGQLHTLTLYNNNNFVDIYYLYY